MKKTVRKIIATVKEPLVKGFLLFAEMDKALDNTSSLQLQQKPSILEEVSAS